MKIGKPGPSAEDLAKERAEAAAAQREGVIEQARRQDSRANRDSLKRPSSPGLFIPRIT